MRTLLPDSGPLSVRGWTPENPQFTDICVSAGGALTRKLSRHQAWAPRLTGVTSGQPELSPRPRATLRL